MALQIMTNIKVDFYDKKYILINAKQYDDCSRWISITCYNQGNLFNLSSSKHSVYIRYRKADGHGVLNSCRVNNKGEVLVELTEQMLAATGICYVDLIVVDKGKAIVDIDTGEITTIDNSSILSTMAFCINVYEASFDNSIVESSYEFNALNELITKSEADYIEVIQLARSYAIGDADGIRDGENTDNSKYYYEQALISANRAKEIETHLSNIEIDASVSEINAKASETNAANSEINAKESETNAANSERNALASEQNAKTSENNASNSEQKANTSENNAKESETKSEHSANLAKSYAIGDTGIREGEDINNAYYYYELSKAVANGLEGGFIPIGTIKFSELKTAEKVVGFTYNINEEFTTDNTFAEGAGVQYPAGTNVYYTNKGNWACFGGASLQISLLTSSVDEVRNYLGI